MQQSTTDEISKDEALSEKNKIAGEIISLRSEVNKDKREKMNLEREMRVLERKEDQLKVEKEKMEEEMEKLERDEEDKQGMINQKIKQKRELESKVRRM